MATVDDNGIHNVISIDRIMLATTTEEAGQTTKVKRRDYELLKGDDTRHRHVVKRITRPEHFARGIKYLIHWNGNSSADDR